MESCERCGEQLGELGDGELVVLRIECNESVALPRHPIPTLCCLPLGCNYFNRKRSKRASRIGELSAPRDRSQHVEAACVCRRWMR